MRVFALIFTLAWISLFHLIGAQNSTEIVQLITELKAAVPACAFNCIVQEVAQSTCAVTNTTCICTNANLTAQMETCLKGNCTVIEQLETAKYQTGSCGAPIHNITKRLSVTVWTLFAFAAIFVISRIISRLPSFGGGNLSKDDLFIILATMGLIATCIVAEELVKAGLGRDIWELTPAQITRVLHLFFFAEVLYSGVILTTKLSILFLYMRIFTKKSFRIQCYVLMGISTCHALAGWLTQPFICRPTSYFWQGWDGQHVGHCPINMNSQTYALAGTNITLDVLIFVIPIPQLLPLQMSWKKKVGVALMFLVGLIETLCSVIRLWTITVWGRTTNPTLDYTSLALWSMIELNVGIVCACMPGMAALLRRVLPRVFGTLIGSSKGTANTNEFHTGRSTGPKISSLSRNEISKTTDVHVEFASETSGRTSENDEYEMLPRMASQMPLRPVTMELPPLRNENYDRGEIREYRKKW